MDVLLADLTAVQKYKLISGAVIPRPIALITTLNEGRGQCRAVQRLQLCQ